MSSYQESVECRTGEHFEGSGFSSATSDHGASVRAIVQIEGNVQGVGFRPFLYQLATEHGLRGTVGNSAAGVDLEIEGPRQAVESFLADIPRRRPPAATVTELRHHFTKPAGYPAFVIGESERDGHRTALISPDLAVCDDCLRELFDPSDRRYRYPLINCTNCGPRYSIIADVPYDRPATTMSRFTMCAACQAEYDDPANRRFHAQPNACSACGPRVWLVDSTENAKIAGRRPTLRVGARNPSAACETQSKSLLRPRDGFAGPLRDDGIEAAARLLQQGAVVAVKGLGGFHLACDATNDQAVEKLRQRKNREEKPFALMVPDLEAARQFCHVDAGAEVLLSSRERPITLLPRRNNAPVADAVAPGNNYLGLMLPYTPLHYLLFLDSSGQQRFRALVMTSGNLSDEPIVIGNREAIQRLGTVADAFLFHDREILIRADDSVVRYDSARRNSSVVGQIANSSYKSSMVRRSRGYVPAPVFLHRDVGTVLAVGGHLKNTIAIARGKTVFLSQHIGDLNNLDALKCLHQSVEHLCQILGVRPALVAHDLHPDYLSTRFAQQLEGCQPVAVQHHHAHVAACMAEHGLDGPVIGIALDGSGYGTDGHVWGGEILIAEYGHFQRVAHLREVPLPGNEQAIKQPWRMALSYLDASFGDNLWYLPIPFVRELDRPTTELLLCASRRAINSPPTSSCGRLFDAVAALVGLRQTVNHEGQAAMELEMAMDDADPKNTVLSDTYDLVHTEDKNPALANDPAFTAQASFCRSFTLDSASLIRAVVGDIQAKVPLPVTSRRFHQALVQSLAEAASRIADETQVRQVVLSGGCFQNRYLQNELTAAIEKKGLSVFSHRLVPPNDGGLALGQIMVASEMAMA